jgi:diguanylate cyclase (GGDEF)-like protein
MTLYRQLMLGVSLLFFAVLAGIMAIYLVNSRQQLQEQLGSQAQEAATSLALRLATLKSLEDRTLVETLVNPMFDRGFFREIRVAATSGEVLVRRVLAPAQGDVPEWFTRLFPLETPGAQSLVSSGWRELGRVVVVSHPNFAYQQLWHTGLQTFLWLALAYAVAIAAVIAFLGMLLRPLRDIEQAAAAIGERDFRTIAFTPRARELAQVVAAMNAMSQRIRQIIAEESAQAEALRREVFVDPLTALYNRRGFRRQLQSLIRSRGDVYSGALALLEIGRFGEYNQSAGFQRGDEMLTLVAGALTQATEGQLAVCGRLSGAGFAFAAVNLDAAGLERLVAAVCGRIGTVIAEQGAADALHFACGAARCEGAMPEFSTLLASADHALQRAREQGENQHVIEAFDPAVAEGSQAWRTRIEQAIDSGRLALFGQNVLSLPGRAPLHSEVTVRMLAEHGEPIAAGQFLPMAARHGLIPRLDCRMLEMLLDCMARGAVALPQVAVNISARTVADAEAPRRLLALLDAHRRQAERLVFEMTEFGAMQEWQAAQRFSGEVRRRGARFALDNFGMLQESLMLVHSLRPHYIKLSPGYSRELQANPDTRFLVSSIVKIASSLDIGIIAQAVEDEALVPLLLELGLTGYQGYATELPVRIA